MITIQLKDEGVDAALGRAAATLDDLTPVMNDIGDFLVGSAQDRIGREESPDGTPFASRSAATLERYRAKGERFGGVLHKTGTMRGRIAHAYGPDFVEVGVNAKQAAVMQFGQARGASGTNARGMPIPWGDIPARPFLGISDDDREGVAAIVGEALRRALTGG